jgi:hypothetical protein
VDSLSDADTRVIPAMIEVSLDGQTFESLWSYSMDFVDVHVVAMEPSWVGLSSSKLIMFVNGVYFPEKLW